MDRDSETLGTKKPKIAIVYKSQDFVHGEGKGYDHFQFRELNKITNCSNIDYLNIYRKLGRNGFLRYLDDYIEVNSINILLFFPQYWLDFDVEILKHLRKKVYIVYLIHDDEVLYDTFTKYYGQLADLILTTDYYATFKYSQMGIDSIWYFPSYDTTKYKHLNLERNIEVSMIGRMDKDDTKELIEYLSNNNITVETYGLGTERGFIDFEAMIKVFNSTKINLNTTGIAPNTLMELEPAIHKIKQNKGRITEIALTKSFVLSEYAPGIEKIFELGKEIEVFKDKEELLQKVKYYLAHEDEREEIAKRGYERALRDYNSEIVFPRIIREIYEKYERVDWSKRQKEQIKVYFNDTFQKIYSNYRFGHMVFFLRHKRFNHAKQELKTFLVYKKFDLKLFLYFAVPEIRRTLTYRALLKLCRAVAYPFQTMRSLLGFEPVLRKT